MTLRERINEQQNCFAEWNLLLIRHPEINERLHCWHSVQDVRFYPLYPKKALALSIQEAIEIFGVDDWETECVQRPFPENGRDLVKNYHGIKITLHEAGSKSVPWKTGKITELAA